MNIIADENIPFAKELFSTLGHVKLLPGRDLTAKDVRDADILLTRSVTKVNENLLSESNIRFVGTCTIGTDHIDNDYLLARNIGFASAPGCNALGVVQYDMCALAQLGQLDASLRYAVIGCGNVGGRVYRALKNLGFNCIGIDPHLTAEQIPDLKPFEAIYDCDVICMHTPRIQTGPYPTENLIGANELKKLKPGAVLLNAGRGECIDNDALLKYLRNNSDLHVVLDVWAGEPKMNPELHPFVEIGTPHIAGYSFEGRVNGSTMIFEALASYLERPQIWIDEELAKLRSRVFGPRQDISASSLSELVLGTYDIKRDHEDLKNVLDKLPTSFDLLRKQYFKRREFGHYLFKSKMSDKTTGSMIAHALGMA